jgi:hypothetical protein
MNRIGRRPGTRAAEIVVGAGNFYLNQCLGRLTPM